MKLIVPVLGAAIIYAGYSYLYDGGLVVADDRVHYLLWALSFIGLVAVIRLAISPLFRHDPEAERRFLDALVDALTDPAVVADEKGRAIYANGPFLKLASRAGVARLVGFDVLYSGYPDFVEPIYQLGQAASEGKAGYRDLRFAAWLISAVCGSRQSQVGSAFPCRPWPRTAAAARHCGA